MSQWTTLHSESHANTEYIDFIVGTVKQQMKYWFQPQQL